MRDLDQPVGEAAVQECGDSMMGGMPPSMGSQTPPPPAHPSMSVNLNAQGLDNIESLMKLMTKVNPDMINQKDSNPEPMAMPMPSILPPGPSLGSLGNLDAGPLKMLPDLDKDDHAEPDADNMGGPSDMDADNKIIKIDLDNDDDAKEPTDLDKDDSDSDDSDEEKKEKDEAFGNSVSGHDGNSYSDMKAATPDGDDLNKPKAMNKHSYRQGDNPMAMPESTDLRTQIRNELAKRLAEAKGAK